jgi:uncharacterized protein (DUF2236 family)
MRTLLTRPLDRLGQRLMGGLDFTVPSGEPAILGPDSVSWRVFGNPLSLYVGGITAVILELAEPRVRHGVWDHSSFRRDPAGRLRRTGAAAMTTVYGARSTFRDTAERVRRMHDRVRGETDRGVAYTANDPDLLLWVQVTALYGFMEAYHRLVAPLTRTQRDRLYLEGRLGARMYGVTDPPSSEADVDRLFDRMRPQLEPSPVIGEFLELMRTAEILPRPLRALQPLVVSAAIELVPADIRSRLDLPGGARRSQLALLKAAARTAEHIELPSSPRAQALRRIGARRSPALAA